ncbi:T9SS type A sorting domain-containing protein [Marinilabilia rubra]|uniref:Secretion system C-terminal sorting domain-containing protein n=1 Tax=Marinilabilia rubra TaxID=2162893 RepID=A0A2U2B5U0_9BACT|nr:T9SS type A sorting domain-containing protein [Marinilabilia rubra]PWD98441.1 hypothetical protein DDZ16_15285 [Marinilabilia rubra]
MRKSTKVLMALFFGFSLMASAQIEYDTWPFNEDFESADYVVGNQIFNNTANEGSDSWWTTTPQFFDRFWREKFTTEYTLTVVEEAHAGSKAVMLDLTTLSGKDFKLRSVNIPEGDYQITLWAKTDAAGLGNAKIGFSGDETQMVDLTEVYQEFSGTANVTANPNNGTTRLSVIFFNNETLPDGTNYKVWIDDITIDEYVATSINKVSKSDVKFYPNPATSEINLETPGKVEKVEIYSLTGQKVKEVETPNSKVDVSSLNDGIYFMTILTEGQKINKKFIKE